MNSVSSLEGNDIFEISRIFQKMYENELDDYVEVIPPQLNEISSKSAERNTSFKAFLVLFNKLVAYSDAYAYKKTLAYDRAPKSTITEDDRVILDRFLLTTSNNTNFRSFSSKTLSDIAPKRYEDYLNTVSVKLKTHPRVEGKKYLIEKSNQLFEKYKSDVADKLTTASKIGYMQEMQTVHDSFVKSNEIVEDVETKSASLQDSNTYDNLNRVNDTMTDLLAQLKNNSVQWNELIVSGAIRYKKEEVMGELGEIISNVHGNPMKSTLYLKAINQLEKLEKFIIQFGETGTIKIDETKTNFRFQTIDYNDAPTGEKKDQGAMGAEETKEETQAEEAGQDKPNISNIADID